MPPIISPLPCIEETPLYPLLLTPIYKNVLWGGERIAQIKGEASKSTHLGESWELSDLGEDSSVIANGKLAGKTLNELLVLYGHRLLQGGSSIPDEFPLLVKLIDAHHALSIQVHPENKPQSASTTNQPTMPKPAGKNELWYIVAANPQSWVAIGVDPSLSIGELETIMGSSAITRKLRYFSVQSGDAFYIPAGTVHAIGAGCLVAEIQQPSRTTYRLYDYDRTDPTGQPRPLHPKEALAAINIQSNPEAPINYAAIPDQPVLLLRDDYFSTFLLDLQANYTLAAPLLAAPCCVVQNVGGVARVIHQGQEWQLPTGHTALLPAEILPQCQLVKDSSSKQSSTLLLSFPHLS